jgi:arylsulfatase A-like enzyme
MPGPQAPNAPRRLGVVILFVAAAAIAPGRSRLPAAERPPNVVIIYADDLGYGNVGCYGAQGYETPHLDRLAADGVRFTDFYVAQAVCSASRTALLTGCYPNRVGILGALGPRNEHGIHDDETLLSEILRDRGYATAIFGKWHLGHHPCFLPTRHGFDEYFGLPYSNDMWPKHPERAGDFPDLPLVDGERIVEYNPDQRQLTQWYTQRAVDFIRRHRDRSFFLYLPHSMPHVPLHVSPEFEGKTSRGLFGDVISEIDWSVGQVLSTLEELELDRQTLVIFASDNGPWLSYGDHAGSAGPLREGKGTTFDGGVRVPCLMRYPGVIPAGRVCSEPAMTIDLLPTIARLAGGEPPQDRIIDGRDIWPLATTDDAVSPHEALYFYWNGELQAVRSRRWKLHLPHEYRTLTGQGASGGDPAAYTQARIELTLFDMANDPGETRNVASQHVDVVERMQSLVETARVDLGDTATGRQGANVRPAGQFAKAQ